MTTNEAGQIGDGHAEPHAVAQARPHHAVNYVAIFVVQVVLMLVTVLVAAMHIESMLLRAVLILSVAAINAAAVALFFMHLKYEGKLFYLILLVPVFLSVVLIAALIPDIVHADQFPGATPYPLPTK